MLTDAAVVGLSGSRDRTYCSFCLTCFVCGCPRLSFPFPFRFVLFRLILIFYLFSSWGVFFLGRAAEEGKKEGNKLL